MKKIVFLLFVGLSFWSSCSKDEDGDPETEVSKNRVITVMEYEWKYGEKSTNGDLHEKFVYNANNKLISKETHYKNAVVGRIPCYYTYTYDDKGHLIKSTAEVGYTPHVYKYTFNSIDSIETMQEYDEDGGLVEEWTYTYDEQRRLVQAKKTWMVSSIYVYDYSYTGNNVKVVTHRNGELFGTTLYVYDDHKNLIKQTWTNAETGKENLSELNEYTYDAQGRIQRKTIYEKYLYTDMTYNDYTYNADGSITSIHVSYSWKSDQSDLDYTYTLEDAV